MQSSLLVEAGLPSLNQLIKDKNMKYMVKLKKLPYRLIDSERLSADDVSILNKPEESIRDLQLETQNIITQNLQIFPPWQENLIEICEEMKLKRQQMVPQEMRNNFLQHLEENHRNQTHINTDGSKTRNGSAYAAVTEGIVIARERLPKEASIFTTELYAMNAALKWVEERGMHGSVYTGSRKKSPGG